MAMAENKKVKNDPLPLKKEPSLIRVKIPVLRMLKTWKLCLQQSELKSSQ